MSVVTNLAVTVAQAALALALALSIPAFIDIFGTPASLFGN